MYHSSTLICYMDAQMTWNVALDEIELDGAKLCNKQDAPPLEQSPCKVLPELEAMEADEGRLAEETLISTASSVKQSRILTDIRERENARKKLEKESAPMCRAPSLSGQLPSPLPPPRPRSIRPKEVPCTMSFPGKSFTGKKTSFTGKKIKTGSRITRWLHLFW